MKNRLRSCAQAAMCFLGHHGEVEEMEISYDEYEGSSWAEIEGASVCTCCGKIWASGDVIIELDDTRVRLDWKD